ncbi:MAG TPA: dienelactone hydrolase family protein [Rhodocyclaceae bacterium]|nr:dienelactone hydrolase family protein [Rhodocyclaceae bacterium]
MTRPDPEFDSLLPEVPVTRRGFVVTALGAGFALAARPIMARTAIHTDSGGLVAGEIKVPVADGMMPAYRARPETGASFPVVLVVHEIFGVHEYIKDVCRRLAHAGYLAIAPELYARQGDVSKMGNIQDILDSVVAKVPDAQVASDLDACVAWAGAHHGNLGRLGITGFCRGGRTVWLYAAHNTRLRAGVAWYGPLETAATAIQPASPVDVAGQLKAPVLGLYGGKDQGIGADDIEDMREALKAAGGASRIHVYPDAPHGFHADYRASYREGPAEDGWRRMLSWFSQHGV